MLDDEQKPLHEQATSGEVPAEHPVWPPPPRLRPPQGPSRTIKVLAIVLAALLVASGLGLAIYATTNQYGQALGAQTHVNVNATVQDQADSQATIVSSLQGTAQSLATAQARIYATATAQAQPTATDQALGVQATTLEDLLTQDTGGKPALDDTLSDNSQNNQWDVESTDNNNTGCNFVDSTYQVQEALPGFLHTCFADATNFSNFVYQVSMTISSGSEGGLLFRANPLKGQYYLFKINVNGTYTFELYNGSAYALLASGTSPAILPGLDESNDLAVIADKGVFSLFVNSTYVAGASSKTLSSGQIGVAVYNTNLPVIVDFSDAKVWKLAAHS